MDVQYTKIKYSRAKWANGQETEQKDTFALTDSLTECGQYIREKIIRTLLINQEVLIKTHLIVIDCTLK